MKNFAFITPSKAVLKGTVGEKISQVVTVVPDAGNPFKIISSNVLHGVDFRYSMKEIEIDGKSAYEFTIENTRTSAGRYLDQINILTDKTGNNPITIIISGNIKPSGPATQGYGIMPNTLKQK